MSYTTIKFLHIDSWPANGSEASINKWVRNELTNSKFEFIKNSLSTYSEELMSLYLGYNCPAMTISELSDYYFLTKEKIRTNLYDVIIEMQKITKRNLYRINTSQYVNA